VAQRFHRSRIVALSTGNVYPLTPATGSGPDEMHPVSPVGEYAQSCLGRERMFEYFSKTLGIPVALIRLNYAIDLRYGVLYDIATKVFRDEPVDLSMGYVNVIWQGDANAAILRCLERCASPPFVLNLTGPEVVPVRELAEAFGAAFDKTPRLEGTERSDALLSNASRYVHDFGPPTISLKTMIRWVAHWVEIGGATLNKPTHFETRDGKF
jgi:nucleoside-diphosphate-sugar epimerase